MRIFCSLAILLYLSIPAPAHELVEFPPIPCPQQEDKGGDCQISVQHDLAGLHFSAPDALFAQLDCLLGQSFFYSLAILLKSTEKSTDNPHFEDYLKRCRVGFDALLSAQLGIGRFPTASQVPHIKKALGQRVHIAQWMALIKEAQDLPRYFPEEKARFARARAILKQIRSIPSPFWRSWIELALALHSSNRAWIQRQAHQIATTGYRQIFFHLPHGFEPSGQAEINPLLMHILQKFIQHTGEQHLGRLISGKLAQLSGQASTTWDRPFYDNWRLSELRQVSKKGPRTRRYFDFWYSKYLGRTSTMERQNFLNAVLTPRTLEEAHPSQLWVFGEDFAAEGPRLRPILDKKLANLWKSKSFYQRLVVVQLLANPTLKEELAKSLPAMNRPLAEIRRDYFRELLHSGQAPELALYHLIKMGDLDRKYLWWVALSRRTNT